MKKMFRTTIILALMLFVSLALFSCGKELSGVTFENSTLTYTGAEQTVEVKGAPEGATVTYSPSNKFTEAGTYEITATVKAEGYDDKVLKATVVVAPKTLNVTWINKGPFGNIGKAPTFKYTLEGVAEGDEVALAFDFGEYDFKKAGTKPVTVTATNKNYTLKAEDTSFDVKFGAVDCTVSFETGVDTELADETVRAGKKVDTPRTLNNLGYTFDGWYYGDKKWDFEKDIVEEDMTLAAKWIPVEYNVSYNLNGGVNSPNNPQTITVETEKQLEVPTKEGYVFLGWFKDRNFTQPADKIGGIRQNLNLYAKWTENKLTDTVTADKIDETAPSLMGSGTAINGDFTYVFSANIADFAEDGAIYIGRGFDTVDGSYFKISSTHFSTYTNDVGAPIVSTLRTHSRSLIGYVTVFVQISNGSAAITIHTADGESSTDHMTWSGRVGEIFFSAENVQLTNATLGWYSKAYTQPVWVIGDNDVNLNLDSSWANRLYSYGYRDFLAMGAKQLDSAAALGYFEEALSVATPKYAIWAFASESGADYEANLASFLSICEQKQITPVLTTHSTAFGVENAAKNAAVKASGMRYVDFEIAGGYDGAVNGGSYTRVGAELLFARIMLDFPEIISTEVPVRTQKAETIVSVSTQEISSMDKATMATAAKAAMESAMVMKDTIGSSGNIIKDGKYLIFNAKIDGELQEGQYIKVGHGFFRSAWVSIDASNVTKESYTGYLEDYYKTSTNPHNLTIKNYITVIITKDVDNMDATLSIFTDGGYYYTEIGWSGEQGDMFAISDGLELKDATMHWVCKDYAKDIWVVGDSYLTITNDQRWPYHFYQAGYQNALMIGYPGMKSPAGVDGFKDALQFGTPKYLVWCMGMNDGDRNGVLNQSYIDCITEVFEICEEKGIIPVVSTIPTCLAVNNTQKNICILNKENVFANYDYRIIDMASAVDGYKSQKDATWYKDMLHSDEVHPHTLGAKAMYMQFVHDFPEIMGGWDATVYEKENSDGNLASGSKLLIDTPDTLGYESMFTFKGWYSAYAGSLIIGNGDRQTEGATWLEITSDKVSVYQRINGSDVKVQSVDNKVSMQEYVIVKIHVKGRNAHIEIQTTAESKVTHRVFNLSSDWTVGGDVYAESVGIAFTDARLNWYTV